MATLVKAKQLDLVLKCASIATALATAACGGPQAAPQPQSAAPEQAVNLIAPGTESAPAPAPVPPKKDPVVSTRVAADGAVTLITQSGAETPVGNIGPNEGAVVAPGLHLIASIQPPAESTDKPGTYRISVAKLPDACCRAKGKKPLLRFFEVANPSVSSQNGTASNSARKVSGAVTGHGNFISDRFFAYSTPERILKIIDIKTWAEWAGTPQTPMTSFIFSPEGTFVRYHLEGATTTILASVDADTKELKTVRENEISVPYVDHRALDGNNPTGAQRVYFDPFTGADLKK